MKYLKKILEFVGKTIAWYCLLSLVGFTAFITRLAPNYGMIVLISAIIITLTGDLGELIHKKFGNNEIGNNKEEE